MIFIQLRSGLREALVKKFGLFWGGLRVIFSGLLDKLSVIAQVKNGKRIQGSVLEGCSKEG